MGKTIPVSPRPARGEEKDERNGLLSEKKRGEDIEHKGGRRRCRGKEREVEPRIVCEHPLNRREESGERGCRDESACRRIWGQRGRSTLVHFFTRLGRGGGKKQSPGGRM